MLIKSWVFSVVLLLILSILLPACNPAAGVVQRTALPADASEPTSIMVAYRTPKPTATQTSAAPAATLTPTLNFDPDYYTGGLTVTLDYVGKIVPLRTGQSFLLALGNEYSWSIEISPPDIVGRNMKITPEPGDQGVFVAREKGKAALKAVGVPTCRSEKPACSRPDILFQMAILVE
jgi:hypothetical protein